MKVFTFCLVFCLGTASVQAQEAKWLQASTEHFLLFTDTTEAKAQRLLNDLEGRLAAFADAFGKLRPMQFPIEVFLFKNGEDFTAAVPSRPPVNGSVPPEKNAYLLKGPDRVFLVAKDKSPEDIANDSGHALGHLLFEHQVMWRPFWLAEGIGEYVRKLGRDADTKAVSEKDGYSVADLLTIVPSATYQDNDPGGAFRTQSYRLLRLILRENPAAIRELIQAAGRENGAEAKIKVDVDDIAVKFAAYTETPLKMIPVASVVKVEAADPVILPIHRGDLLMATDRTSEASRWYNADSKEARAARAIVTRYSRMKAEAVTALARAAQELPESGLVQYHFGALDSDNPKQREAQVTGLERSVKLLPLFGRAYAELARLYTLTDKPDRALPLLARALELEPEFADTFYELRANALLALRDYDGAFLSMKTAEALPHADRQTTEGFGFKVSNLVRKIDAARREVDSRGEERIRREMEKKVTEREPVQRPVPPAPIPPGQINYEIAATTNLEVIQPIYPDYSEDLRKRGIAGRVTLRLEVTPDGKVKNAAATASQAPELTAAAVEAARKWIFKVPPRTRPTSVMVSLTFIYALR